jgi:hypothetical protein
MLPGYCMCSGNSDTLARRTKEQGIDIRDAVVDFHRKCVQVCVHVSLAFWLVSVA